LLEVFPRWVLELALELALELVLGVVFGPVRCWNVGSCGGMVEGQCNEMVELLVYSISEGSVGSLRNLWGQVCGGERRRHVWTAWLRL